ncbi:MAG: MATE family efflux transporter [Pseudoflavonifractor sp.]|nr:MATE family efflux transporter [Pseudoflavonifractor sp.]MDY3020396.1 MATE family efflux transporter [Oscillospiraceae bacterium]
MTQGPIGRILLRFALPLFLGNLFQQLYNTVDSLVVGNFSGNEALAAVSSSGSLCFLIIGFFQGVFAGASVVISRRYGARDGEGVDRAVHATVIFSLAAGLLLTVLGVGFTPAILRWIGTPENVMPDSVLYFRIYCSGLLGLVLYNTANGIFQALGDSRHPLYYLIVSSVVNVVLDLLFVAVWDMGVAGAALATVIGQCLSALLGFLHLMSGRFLVRVSLRRLRADPTVLGLIFRLGLPSGVQNSVIAIANVVVQSHINAFGDNAMAGCGSYFKVEGFVFLPITCLTLAMTTFVSQNLGAQRYDRVKEGARLGTLMTVGLSEAVGVAVFLLAPFLIGLFTPDPAVIAFGVRQARVEALFYCMLAFSHSAASILRGAGRAVIPMAVMLAVWCVFRISYITFMVPRFQDITVVFTAYPITWSISSILFALTLWKGNWMSMRV